MNAHLHATELEAVGISLVMGGKVVVVENPDAENSRVNACAQEEDGDEARHLVDKTLGHNLENLKVVSSDSAGPDSFTETSKTSSLRF